MAMPSMYTYSKPKNYVLKEKSQIREIKKKEIKKDPYLEQKVLSAKPEELTLMLYEGMVKFINQAILYNEQNNISSTNNSIQRAQAIIRELTITLDMSYEISSNLALMYDYMERRLIEANVSKDGEILKEVLGYAKDLRDTWKQVILKK